MVWLAHVHCTFLLSNKSLGLGNCDYEYFDLFRNLKGNDSKIESDIEVLDFTMKSSSESFSSDFSAVVTSASEV